MRTRFRYKPVANEPLAWLDSMQRDTRLTRQSYAISIELTVSNLNCDYIHFECAGVAPASQERCCLRSRNLNQSGYCPGCAQERCCPLGENTSVNIYIRCTGVAPSSAREVLPLLAKNRKNHKSFTGSAAVRSTSIVADI